MTLDIVLSGFENRDLISHIHSYNIRLSNLILDSRFINIIFLLQYLAKIVVCNFIYYFYRKNRRENGLKKFEIY